MSGQKCFDCGTTLMKGAYSLKFSALVHLRAIDNPTSIVLTRHIQALQL